jgi:hypothetical protein
VLKLCAFFELYSFNDCAAELIEAFRTELTPIIECDILLTLLASGMSGKSIQYRQYMQKYFEPSESLSKSTADTTVKPPRRWLDRFPDWIVRLVRPRVQKLVQALQHQSLAFKALRQAVMPPTSPDSHSNG